MAFVILLSIAAAVVLLLIVARYARHPALLRAELEEQLSGGHRPQQPRITPGRFHHLVQKLLPKLGLEVREIETLPRDGALRVRATAKGALRDVAHVIYVEARSPADRIGPEVLLELAEDVNATDSAVGVLICTCHVDRAVTAGIDPRLELIDGVAFERLVVHHLPQHAAEARRYQLTGTMKGSAPDGPNPTLDSPHAV